MGRSTPATLAAATVTAPDGVATCAGLRRQGVTPGVLAARCRPGGPWRRLLPGIVQLGTEQLNRRQQLLAATWYAGPGAVVTALDALYAHGLRVSLPPEVRVLVPVQRRVSSRDFACLERTSRLPQPVARDGIAFAPPARAAIDAARRETSPERLRRLLSLPVYYGLCSGSDLHAELAHGNQRGTAAVREVLRGLGSLTDVRLRGSAGQILDALPLPPPLWRVTVCDRHGRPIGVVDAWWDEVGLGWQFDACGSELYGQKRNDLALIAAGVVVVRTPPKRIHDDDRRIARELVSAFATAAKRPRPQVLALGMVTATS